MLGQDEYRGWTLVSSNALSLDSDLRGIESAAGITDYARYMVSLLVDEYQKHAPHNNLLLKYYNGDVVASDYGVTAGDIKNDQTCDWPQKAVSAWAERITLERFTLPAGVDRSVLDSVVDRSNVIDGYNQHVPVKGLFGCMAATVNRDEDGHAFVRFHGANTFTALPSPDFTDGVVAAGLAVARREYTTWSNGEMVPTIVNLHTPYNVGEFRQVSKGEWVYSDGPTRERIPTLFVFAHERVGSVAPFGRTRITKFVRTLTDDAIRCMWHMQVSGTFYSMPKLWLTGLTGAQFDAVMEGKSQFQLSRILALTANDETDRDPNFGQLSGNSPQPFIDELRSLATQFSGATGVPISSLGIIQDNPSSAEAIESAREDICKIAERDIKADKSTLVRVMRAAMAIELNTNTDELDDGLKQVQAKFEQPMLYSLASRADWATKINSIRNGFGATDVAARMYGIDDAELDELKAQEQATVSRQMMLQMLEGTGATDAEANPA